MYGFRVQKGNPRVYMDISCNGTTERMIIELFADLVPKTAENFRLLCIGNMVSSNTGKPLHYKGCVFDRIIKGFVCRAGDFSTGTVGESIYGGTFADENHEATHYGLGILSMANDRPNRNGSRFHITFSRQPFLDGCHVVFGKVIKGFETVQLIDRFGTPSGTPSARVVISDCGQHFEESNLNVVDALFRFFSEHRPPAGKEELEAKLQNDNDLKRYEQSDEKLKGTLKDNLLVTNGNDRGATSENSSSNSHQHSDDPSQPRFTPHNQTVKLYGRGATSENPSSNPHQQSDDPSQSRGDKISVKKLISMWNNLDIK